MSPLPAHVGLWLEILGQDMRWKPFLISFAVIAFLWGTFLHPWTQPLWQGLDVAIFKMLNGMLEGSRFFQLFWAFLNHKRMDLVEDVVFLLFFIWGIKTAPKSIRWHKSAQFICFSALMGGVIFFINRHLLRSFVLIPRESPSLVVTPCVRLSHEIPWLSIKDETLASFPGDHATTLLLFGLLYSTFVHKRLAICGWLYVLLRLLPRLVVGAHWFSDIAVGSVSIALFFVACIVYTPIGTLTTQALEKLLKLCGRQEGNVT